MWYYKNIGREKCPIADTFWQTETGGHVITPLPGATPLVPGSCTLPLPGIAAAIVDETDKDLPNGAGGMLVGDRVNLGGLHHGPGRRELLTYLHLTAEDEDHLVKLAAEGVEVSAHDLPDAHRVPLETLLEG